VLDFTGLAQKNGAVLSHVRVADKPETLHAPRVADGACDLLLGCDMVVAASDEAVSKVQRGATHAVVNNHMMPTAAFTLNPDMDFRTRRLAEIVREAAGDNLTDFLPATELATALTGDSIATNVFMLGYAFQRGLLPVGAEALGRAIELNGVAVEGNKRTFALGRLAAHDRAIVEKAAGLAAEPEVAAPESLDDVVEKRVAFLAEYQDRAWAERYRAAVGRIAAAERERAPGMSGLAEAAARNLFKLMSYKDEYEVARLYTTGDFEKKLRHQFEGDLKLKFHLAPPLLARRHPDTGHLVKREFGAWMLPAFRLLARFKGLRGGPLDLFGRTAERRRERELIAEYDALLATLAGALTTDNHGLAMELARLPAEIRGFGHVKERNLARVKARETELMGHWRDPSQRATAAE
jgi:indolepyruvate ferredoxin oxidoreductase